MRVLVDARGQDWPVEVEGSDNMDAILDKLPTAVMAGLSRSSVRLKYKRLVLPTRTTVTLASIPPDAVLVLVGRGGPDDGRPIAHGGAAVGGAVAMDVGASGSVAQESSPSSDRSSGAAAMSGATTPSSMHSLERKMMRDMFGDSGGSSPATTLTSTSSSPSTGAPQVPRVYGTDPALGLQINGSWVPPGTHCYFESSAFLLSWARHAAPAVARTKKALQKSRFMVVADDAMRFPHSAGFVNLERTGQLLSAAPGVNGRPPQLTVRPSLQSCDAGAEYAKSANQFALHLPVVGCAAWEAGIPVCADAMLGVFRVRLQGPERPEGAVLYMDLAESWDPQLQELVDHHAPETILAFAETAHDPLHKIFQQRAPRFLLPDARRIVFPPSAEERSFAAGQKDAYDKMAAERASFEAQKQAHMENVEQFNAEVASWKAAKPLAEAVTQKDASASHDEGGDGGTSADAAAQGSAPTGLMTMLVYAWDPDSTAPPRAPLKDGHGRPFCVQCQNAVEHMRMHPVGRVQLCHRHYSNAETLYKKIKSG